MAKLIKKIFISEFGLKLKERFFPTKNGDPDTATHLMQAMKRFQECDNKKNLSRIRHEIRICKKYWKCYPHHYFINNLYRSDNEITDEELINYIPQFYWHYVFLPHYSSPLYYRIGENKLIIEQFFKALRISQPKTLCLLLHGDVYSSGMERLSGDQIQQELLQKNPEKIFVKPAESYGGKGIQIFHKNSPGHYVNDNDVSFDLDFLNTIGKDQDYIIQYGITQSQEISDIYPESVNTFRVITENKNGQARIVCAMLRIGRDHKEIDNISSGGICVKIDLITGKLGDFAISYNDEKIDHHPDTHVAFRNVTISQWDEIRKFTINSASKMPYLTYLGWDIALTPEGPVAIEINRTPAIDIIEMVSGRGLREEFRIDNPDYYWKNLGKRADHFK
jgi:hypothetical protein